MSSPADNASWSAWVAVARELSAVVQKGNSVIRGIAVQVKEEMRRAEVKHRRAALRRAYIRRGQWKKADVPRLLALDVNTPARRRVERIQASKHLGRGVVGNYQPLSKVILTTVQFFQALYDPDTPPHIRLGLLKQTTWWPYFAESLYRGEYEMAKEAKEKSPSVKAEERSAECLHISPDLLRKICGKVRRERGDTRPDNPPIRVTEFEVWKATGRFHQDD